MPTIPVTILGPKESGKTVYLSSLFRRLAVQREDVGCFVTCPPRQSDELNRAYSRVIGPDGWPDPHALAHTWEWRFTCSVRTEHGRIFSPFTINYLDYTGDHLALPSEQGTGNGRAVWRCVQDAEFLMVLLDGAKILRCFDGDFGLVRAFVPVFHAIEQSRAVVYFLLTKWDLLEAAGHSLRSVLDCLLLDPDFDAFHRIRLRQSRAVALRFFPVSSVGKGFAVQAPDGRMLKRRRYRAPWISPLHVEMPFMAVLPDLFRRELHEIVSEIAGDEAWRGNGTPAERERQLKRLQTIRNEPTLIHDSLDARAATSPVLQSMRKTVADAFIDDLDRRITTCTSGGEKDSAAALRHRMLEARSEREAVAGMVGMTEATLSEFEATHSGSLAAER
ncbi:hypothetical protein [Streptomyces sp. NPDC003077]|uniref:hypothetical protein n=1 Tax=Streptomyces sp. NPDC003077 TaxID=3154443 RepID=UPI0033BE258D